MKRKKMETETEQEKSRYYHMVLCTNCGARYMGIFSKGQTIDEAFKKAVQCLYCGVSTEWHKAYRSVYERWKPIQLDFTNANMPPKP